MWDSRQTAFSRRMSATKIYHVLAIEAMLCVSLVLGGPVKQVSRRTVAGQGGAVVFYVAYQGSLRDVEFNPIVFDQVLVNHGSAYDNKTGVFTAPVQGIYQFLFSAQICRGDHNNNWDFMINGNRGPACHSQVAGTDTVLNTCYFLMDLKKGEMVWVKQRAGSCAWANTLSKTITFSGVLLVREGVSTLEGNRGPGNSCPLPSPELYKTPKSGSAGRDAGAALCWMAVTLLLGLFFMD